jgi:hypothetical protein
LLSLFAEELSGGYGTAFVFGKAGAAVHDKIWRIDFAGAVRALVQ